MIRQVTGICLSLLIVLSSTVSSANVGGVQDWDFTVYLDEQEIGYHRFMLTPGLHAHTVQIQAEFNVKFLFLTVYTYTHTNIEQWSGDCLVSINAFTDDNGDQHTVRGSRQNNGDFVIKKDRKEVVLRGCVRTFSYWDPAILTATQLLNSQTGEYMDIEVIPLGSRDLEFSGQRVISNGYRLQGKDLLIDLWYSQDDRWLALESTTTSGKRLRYQINQPDTGE
jgi:hypothetical protein